MLDLVPLSSIHPIKVNEKAVIEVKSIAQWIILKPHLICVPLPFASSHPPHKPLALLLTSLVQQDYQANQTHPHRQNIKSLELLENVKEMMSLLLRTLKSV